ncbi:unnamed protein product [Boreogadus saida]
MLLPCRHPSVATQTPGPRAEGAGQRTPLVSDPPGLSPLVSAPWSQTSGLSPLVSAWGPLEAATTRHLGGCC